MSEIEVTIPDTDWLPNDALEDPRNRLLAHIRINGLDMHLEAWEVTVKDGIQQAVAPEDGDDFDNFYSAVGADGHFDTVEIQGREYVLLASPFC